jgi:hypothetical protein
MDTDTTNLVVADDTAAATVPDDNGVAAEAQVEEQQFDENGEPIEAAVEEEEVDFDDLKLRVPKDAAQKVRDALLRQADYTRKTQELAEQRKAIETERSTFQQASQQEIAAQAQVFAIDQALADYANVNWANEMQAARQAYDQDRLDMLQTEFARYTQLKDQRGQAAQTYQSLAHQRVSTAQQETAKRMEEGRAAVAAEIRDWDAVAPKVMEAGIRHYRFTAEELNSFADPRFAIVLNDARQWREHTEKTKAATRHTTAQQAAPAAKAGGGNAIPPGKLDDRLSAEEWMRRRNADVAKKNGR